MKKSRTLLLIMSLLVAFVTCSASADSLMQVYDQAVHNDPTFKKAEADWQAAKENFPIALSTYLPLLNITGGLSRNYTKTLPNKVASDGYYNLSSWSVTVTQPIFNLASWASIKGARASVKSATATYLGAIQDLMVRTANAYFDVLQASEKLRFTIASKNAVYQQLRTAEQQFKVGLIAITSVYDAQSSYDQSIADEIRDRNILYNRLEELRAITGQHYVSLTGLKNTVPLTPPTPNDIDAWVRVAERQNYGLTAQNYTAISSRENIKQQSAARWPVLDASGTYGSSHKVENGDNSGGSIGGSLGLSLSFAPFQGGAVIANTSQARYQYESALHLLEATHRSVVKDTRQSYLGVMSGINRIKADLQTIRSAEKALSATKAGYVVGTRTMVNVLDDVKSVYQAQNTYMSDEYNYIKNIINLKSDAGTLSVNDLRQIDSWFKKVVKFKLASSIYTMPSKPHIAKPPIKVAPLPKAPIKKKIKTPKAKASHVHNDTLHKGFGVQVYASHTRSLAEHFIQQHKLSDAYVLKHGKFYRVVIGSYKTHHAAQQSISNLSDDLRARHPWVVKG